MSIIPDDQNEPAWDLAPDSLGCSGSWTRSFQIYLGKLFRFLSSGDLYGSAHGEV